MTKITIHLPAMPDGVAGISTITSLILLIKRLVVNIPIKQREAVIAS